MSQVMPQGEALRKAVKWISDRKQEEGCPPLHRLVQEACLKFNLSPTDGEFLFRFIKGEVTGQSPVLG